MSCLPPSRYWSYIGGLGLPFLFSLAFLSYQKLSSYFSSVRSVCFGWSSCSFWRGWDGRSAANFNIFANKLSAIPLRAWSTATFGNGCWPTTRPRASVDLLAVMLIDIDNFKSYNDRYGHLLGDEIIQEVAFHLVKIVRSTDTVGRYGGEEFVILVPDVDIPKARLIGERLVRDPPSYEKLGRSQPHRAGANHFHRRDRRRCAEHPFPHRAHWPGRSSDVCRQACRQLRRLRVLTHRIAFFFKISVDSSPSYVLPYPRV